MIVLDTIVLEDYFSGMMEEEVAGVKGSTASCVFSNIDSFLLSAVPASLLLRSERHLRGHRALSWHREVVIDVLVWKRSELIGFCDRLRATYIDPNMLTKEKNKMKKDDEEEAAAAVVTCVRTGLSVM
jgi:hypothetical protein